MYGSDLSNSGKDLADLEKICNTEKNTLGNYYLFSIGLLDPATVISCFGVVAHRSRNQLLAVVHVQEKDN